MNIHGTPSLDWKIWIYIWVNENNSPSLELGHNFGDDFPTTFTIIVLGFGHIAQVHSAAASVG